MHGSRPAFETDEIQQSGISYNFEDRSSDEAILRSMIELIHKILGG
jgi:hypothetical protein